MSGCMSAAGGAICRLGGAVLMRRNVATSAPLLGRYTNRKPKLNTDIIPRSEKMKVAVSDKPDPSRGVPLPDGGIQYFRFKYYPRFPEQPEPPVTPAKLHRVELVRPLVGQPYWVKHDCQKLGLHEAKGKTTTIGAVNVVKNVPSVNAVLYRVKHVVKIDPVTFPDGQPSQDNLEGWQLLEDGRVIQNASYKIEPITTEYDELKLSTPQVKERLRLKWIKPFHLNEKRTV